MLTSLKEPSSGQDIGLRALVGYCATPSQELWRTDQRNQHLLELEPRAPERGALVRTVSRSAAVSTPAERIAKHLLHHALLADAAGGQHPAEACADRRTWSSPSPRSRPCRQSTFDRLGAGDSRCPRARPRSSLSRQRPTASYFSRPNPIGSISRWQPAHVGFSACSSMRSRFARAARPSARAVRCSRPAAGSARSDRAGARA